MWGDHYETLFNCVKSDECKEKIIDFLSSDSNIKNVFIQPCQVKALQSAKLCNDFGHDGLAAEHFIFADGSICVLPIYVVFEHVVAWVFTRGVYEIIYCTSD